MATPARPDGQYSFGVFTVDIRSGELRKHGMRLKLQERPFQLLVALLEKPGETVTREELRQRLWPDGTFVNFDQSISSSVNKLRTALNDSSTHSRFVETVGRRGYRFLADVKLVAANGSLAEKKLDAGPLPLASGHSGLSSPRRWLVLVGAIAIMAAAVTVYVQWKHSHHPAETQGRVMLAVLPFDNLTGDASQDYFSEGLTEEMITQLGRLDPARLGVIARASVMTYQHRQKPIEQVGRELGVQYVLEGSVRRDATKVRITAQLIQVRDQTPLWARQYDRELKDLLLLQDEIAREISDEMVQIALADKKPAASIAQSPLTPQTYEAYNLYLQGQFFLNKRTVKGLTEAINYFEQATAKDPNFARAYAGLADAYALMGGYSGIPEARFIQKARAAALRALEIDETLPEAHTALALSVENYDWDWQTAEKEYRRAIELNPNYATAHHWYAEYLCWRGRFDEALRESKRARQLDPLSLIIATDNAAILYDSRQYDSAIEQFRYVLQMEPNFPRAGVIAEAYVQKGMLADAIDFVEKQMPNDNAPRHLAYLTYVYGRSGRQAQAQDTLDKLLALSRQEEFNPIELAQAYIGVGNKDQALASLEKAYSQRANGLTALKVDPLYDPLRSESRFQALLQRVGLAN